jgi:FAD/FMN-containing dehydrogenase
MLSCIISLPWSAHQQAARSSFKADITRKTSRSGLCFAGQKIRVVGSGLSPNGMAFSSKGMLSTVLLDDIISVDKEKQQVTVQAGARVQQVHIALTTVMYGVMHHRTLEVYNPQSTQIQDRLVQGCWHTRQWPYWP